MPETHESSTEDRTILVADIVSSTSLYESLGNVAAKQRVGGCVDMLTATASGFDGTVVKSLGDGVLCSFADGQRALLAALAMCDKCPTYHLELRIGIHRGEVLEEGDDVFGDAVNTASRIADLAKPREILLSKALKEVLPNYLQAIVHGVPPVSLKGKKAPIELYAVQQDDLVEGTDGSQTLVCDQTVMIPNAHLRSAHLRLRLGETVVSIDGGDAEVVIGRDAEHDLTVASQQVSRRHARVFTHQGKFVLADQSTNGTFLVPDGQPKVHLVREQVILNGSGVIHAGVDPDTGPSEPIYYSVF